MRRLLAVITRMYASCGGDHDEFVASWGGSESQESIVFPTDFSASARILLLIHGYDYPRNPNDDSILRAGRSVNKGLESNDLLIPDCEVGLLFHLPLTWGATAKDHFAEKVLNSADRVSFVREYRSASRLVKELAPRVKLSAEKAPSMASFSTEFDKVWDEYRSNLTRYDIRFGSLLNQIENCAVPLINRIDYWRQHGIGPSDSVELSWFHRTTSEAMKKALDTNGILMAVSRIVNSLILETRSRDKLELIEKTFHDVERFLKSTEGSYAEVHEIVKLFDLSAEPWSADLLQELSEKIRPRNQIRVWYLELVEKMGILRRTLKLPDQSN